MEKLIEAMKSLENNILDLQKEVAELRLATQPNHLANAVVREISTALKFKASQFDEHMKSVTD